VHFTMAAAAARQCGVGGPQEMGCESKPAGRVTNRSAKPLRGDIC
jgi:hypothetical protein